MNIITNTIINYKARGRLLWTLPIKNMGSGLKVLYQLGSDLGKRDVTKGSANSTRIPFLPLGYTRASTHRVGVTTQINQPITLSRPSSEPMITSHPGGEHTPGYTRARALRIRRTQETTETHTPKNSKDFDKRLLSQFFVFDFYFLIY